MVKWTIVYAKHATEDAQKLGAAGLKAKVLGLLEIIEHNPFQTPLPYKKLVGDLHGAYSRRINIRHLLVYEVFRKEQVVRV